MAADPPGRRSRKIGPAQLTVMTIAASAHRSIIDQSVGTDDGSETGGILLGHDRPGRLDIVVAGEPGPAATRTATGFTRDLEHARHLGRAAHRETGALWVGEWHTHPDGPDHPSARDRQTYRDFVADPELALTVFAALIVRPSPTHRPGHSHPGPTAPSTTPPPASIIAWICDTTTIVSTQLHIV